MVDLINSSREAPLKEVPLRLKEEGLRLSETIDEYLDKKVEQFEDDFMHVNAKEPEQKQNICRASKNIDGLTCPECGKNFAAKNTLRMHITGIHQNQGEFCKYCEKIVSFGNLRRHIKEKHQKVKKPCPECGKEYGMSNLSHHIRAIHKKENKQCPECGQFFSRSNISTHIKSVHGYLKKVCDICHEGVSYGLYSEHRLQRHNLTGQMASVLDDPFPIKSEIIEGIGKRIKSLNVGNKTFTFTLE